MIKSYQRAVNKEEPGTKRDIDQVIWHSTQAMVSVQEPSISPNKRNIIDLQVIEQNSTSSNKRKWEDREEEEEEEEDHEISFKNKLFNSSKIKSSSTITTRNYTDAAHDFHLSKSLLPLEWQKCPNIKSREMSCYNTRTQKRTWEDPRNKQCPEKLTTSSVGHMSLELELNLPCQSLRSSTTSTQAHLVDKDNWTLKQDNYSDSFSLDSNSTTTATTTTGNSKISSSREINKNFHGLTRCSSWVSFEEDDQEEMIAAVCMRCHMLVILCKSSPACPNCKFMHPTDQNPVNYKPLLPCKD